MSDTRIEELEALAQQEGFRLPMAADLIAFFEQQGYVVDLHSGEVCRDIAIGLSPSAQALCHLYGVDEEISAIFAPAPEDALELDLFDYDAEAEDIEEDMLDREDWAWGQW